MDKQYEKNRNYNISHSSIMKRLVKLKKKNQKVLADIQEKSNFKMKSNA